jgi:hypothetical protein
MGFFQAGRGRAVWQCVWVGDGDGKVWQQCGGGGWWVVPRLAVVALAVVVPGGERSGWVVCSAMCMGCMGCMGCMKCDMAWGT